MEIAILLAGGRGTRLKSLTRDLAKPAVFFGGKYRIIDFPLSNAANSGIHSVGILTQYESTALNNYIGSGRNWGLNGTDALASILPPRETPSGANWYSGTADAIYQNIDWLDKIESEHDKAIAYHDTVAPKMEEIRYQIDKLELIVEDDLWTLPKYRELLFIR